MADNRVYTYIDYEDAYVQPLILAALKPRLPSELLVFINDISELPSPTSRLLQWRQYEQIDFDHLLQHPSTSVANSYIIRKALIRKHYLSTTVTHWLTKHPDSVLKAHVKPSVEFEVDYAEFLDDALVEAWDLKESWARNASAEGEGEKEWWILKPGMSERGQGIRLFSSEEELQAIFEEWDPPESDEEDGIEDGHAINRSSDLEESNGTANGVMTSHLRHFVAQPYIHPPLLLPSPHPSAGRKFHIRTYVLATSALRVHVYRRMLALFAADPYTAPGDLANEDLSRHLTNTCLQAGDREGSVHAFWDLPKDIPRLQHGKAGAGADWREDVFSQICQVTGEVFEAAARTMSIHFQPLPNAFEVFALDFLVDAGGTAWLLEVNAFPDFAQTGDELQDLAAAFFQGVVDVAVRPCFAFAPAEKEGGEGNMVRVLDIDLGRR